MRPRLPQLAPPCGGGPRCVHEGAPPPRPQSARVRGSARAPRPALGPAGGGAPRRRRPRPARGESAAAEARGGGRRLRRKLGEAVGAAGPEEPGGRHGPPALHAGPGARGCGWRHAAAEPAGRAGGPGGQVLGTRGLRGRARGGAGRAEAEPGSKAEGRPERPDRTTFGVRYGFRRILGGAERNWGLK